MKKTIITIFLSCVCVIAQAQDIIVTIAGNGSASYCCDHDLATNARIFGPQSLCLDKDGNIYLTDCGNHRIRRIDNVSDTIKTIAGTGTGGYNGDSLNATDAQLFVPDGIFVSDSKNIFISDPGNHRIRKVDGNTGILTTICGNGSAGNSGDGGMATNAQINVPVGLYADQDDDVYFADASNNNVRRIDAITNKISTVAGTGIGGYSGDGGLAVNAELSEPGSVFLDSHGNIFISETGNHVLRRIDNATGLIQTIAGDGNFGYAGDGLNATACRLNQPTGIFIDSTNNIFISDWGNGAVRKIDALTGVISTVVGYGVQGFAGDNGPADSAKTFADDVWVDALGSIYIADMNNNRIRKIYNPKLAVASQSIKPDVVKLFPNPAQREITISYNFENEDDGIIQLLNLTGQTLITRNLSHNKKEQQIDITGFPPGLYLYKVLQQGIIVATGKVIKE